MVNLIPELALIIGEQPPVLEPPQQERQIGSSWFSGVFSACLPGRSTLSRCSCMIEKHGLYRFSARVYLVFAVHVAHWTQHLRICSAFLRRAFQAAQEACDLSYAAYSCIDLITNRFATGDSLIEVEREAEEEDAWVGQS